MRYTIFSNRDKKQYFFSTDHLQRFNSSLGIEGDGWVPCSGSLPIRVVPRPSLPDGLVDTMEKYLMIFHDDETEIPNPDYKFIPDWRKSWKNL